MNDFTKEELKIIYLDICVFLNKSKIFKISSLQHHIDLRDKVDEMIDNYCEHECQHRQIVTGAYPRSNPPKKCDVCEALYYE